MAEEPGTTGSAEAALVTVTPRPLEFVLGWLPPGALIQIAGRPGPDQKRTRGMSNTSQAPAAAENPYEATCQRFNRAGENCTKVKAQTRQMLRDAEDEYEAARAALALYETSPGIPKPEYRDGRTGQ
ncbi:MAG TPA: hypothetical protein VF070_06500 [Streptosporangiaceae bacterium]